MNATLIESGKNGLELRRAARKSETWPGYADSFPLNRAGYWIGTHRKHYYVGQSKKIALAEWAESNPTINETDLMV